MRYGGRSIDLVDVNDFHPLADLAYVSVGSWYGRFP
jgi:hypothetical protein